MSKFNFNEILLSARANITKIMENFTKIENNALANSDIVDNLNSTADNKVLSAKQGKQLNDSKLPKSGGTMTGNLNMGSNKIKFGTTGGIEWKEDGYGDKFRIIPDFNGVGTDNKLVIQGTVGGSGEDPSNWVTLGYITSLAETGVTRLFQNLLISKSTGATQFEAKRTDTDVRVTFGVGDGGINHGVYSQVLNKWIVYANNDGAYLNGNAESATNATNATKWANYTNDFSTNNTSDTWLLVLNGGKVQHREIGNIFGNYFQKLSGSLTVGADTSGNVKLNYPSGFNQANCYVVGIGIKASESAGYNWNGVFVNSGSLFQNGFEKYVNTLSDGIRLTIVNPTTSSKTFSYRLLLMKY